MGWATTATRRFSASIPIRISARWGKRARWQPAYPALHAESPNCSITASPPAKKNVKAAGYGLNSRLDNLQAAVLRARLDWLGENNLARSILARRYVDGLADLAESGLLRLPHWDTDHVWHLFTVEVTKHDRDKVTESLRAAGVATDLYYPVLTHRHRVPLVADLFEGVRLPRTEAAHARMFQLPLYPTLTLAEQDRVIGVLHDVLG